MRTDSERTSKLTDMYVWSYLARILQASVADKSRDTDYSQSVAKSSGV
jgi:hypothetical protein